MTDDELFERLRRELGSGWLPIPNEKGWRGSDAPGKLLRKRLGFPGSRPDLPNAGKWHIRFFGGSSESALVTLFGSMGEPEGYLEDLLLRFGKRRADGRISLIHTIRAKSDKGFFVVSDATHVRMRNDSALDLRLPSWSHTSLKTDFAQKYSRLILVQGEVRKTPRAVNYERADVYLEPRTKTLPAAIAEGRVVIEFNVKTRSDGSLRDHGPRFRTSRANLPSLYERHIPL